MEAKEMGRERMFAGKSKAYSHALFCFLLSLHGSAGLLKADFAGVFLSYLKAADTRITFPPLQYLSPVQPKKKKMGGGNGQKAKMAREKNLEKQKAGSKVQGVYADIHLHNFGSEMQGACRSQAPQN
ncbi:hypothetical protein SADUNF_Sadunf02G0101100 [Salix dunnii]|uniref:Small EDRK-rich factor-like N-terminal domain-containing protein n=1 Tax=Salix dunnii TaxID=1413687 RepID=A0A835TGH2_9ROSI|nr:hypothetical protein SADUNF_Sadunf02G0101100 [Salix dunnii]